MKFMKLGSKMDSFQTHGKTVRYVGNELETDIIVNIGDMKFFLHKFPLLSKCGRLQKLISAAAENGNEISLHEIPGGQAAFEICAKFCYGMTVTLNAYNVLSAYCAADFLGMNESIEKGNLVSKIEVFLNSSIFRSWKDPIIVLQTTKSLEPFADELNLISRCIDAIASKACVDTSKVDWSYNYTQRKFPEESGIDQSFNGVIACPSVPRAWWVEDLCELEIDLYKQVISAICARDGVPCTVIGRALKAYALKRLPKMVIDSDDTARSRLTVETIVWLLPEERGTVSCNFLLNLLKASVLVGIEGMTRRELIRRIGQQLEEALVNDLLIPAPEGEDTLYDVDMVQKLVEEFRCQEQNFMVGSEMRRSHILSDASKLMAARLIDDYLVEIVKDPNLPLSKFMDLAKYVSDFSRPSHDQLYRAIDGFLKEHPGMSKSERKRMCKLMDCQKLSPEMCMHAVQNDRLPLHVLVQLLFFEQLRAAAASSGSSTPDAPKGVIKDLTASSNGSSKSVTTTTEEDWDGLAMAEELRALKGEVASLRLGSEMDGEDGDGGVVSRMKGLLRSRRIFSRIRSRKGRRIENGGSDSLGCLDSANEAKTMAS